jgi:hypothetical protein
MEKEAQPQNIPQIHNAMNDFRQRTTAAQPNNYVIKSNRNRQRISQAEEYFMLIRLARTERRMKNEE